ncbi:bifunctional folylpolyglutamate synthase/dihydrofolate synthase [Robertkochia solimangrovi]|uniref:bifunctional folylpolyglutamate synthase/dihydrofolate synthase n=1 Tax=Robertkochia solimangrovi TaxID=2213046 RepID=UPI00117DC240|nr:folylpolyglutamate synthase/dihydrofolate synthase family protein [Robertkochia solimangrovi]TRZ44296.1 bifunctional folylpolyglutamate synthase/dihydrofolate synthase [Robertkochia solimangrovi]
MTYDETVGWMFRQLPMYQKVGKSAFRPKLSNTIEFAGHLDDPQQKFKSVHVAGTNGKGSTSHMIASILQEAGYKTGLYTSPHLKDFRERIRIDGVPVSETYVVDFIEKHKDFLENLGVSFFEMTVGMAFAWFAEQEVDVAVIEVGLGGRLDSTNIITPELSVITNIGLDHTDILGDTLEKIAAEKAGIIKKGVPVVIGEFQEETLPVFENIAKTMNAPLIKAWDYQTDLKSDLIGFYQELNVRTVVSAIRNLRTFKISESAIKKGLLNTVNNTGLLGRWQQLGESPLIICDTAHNTEGLKVVTRQIAAQKYDRLHMVLGVVKEKNLSTLLPLLPKNAIYYFTEPEIPRALPASEFAAKAESYGLQGSVFPSVPIALEAARNNASPEDMIFVGGSTFVVAEIV